MSRTTGVAKVILELPSEISFEPQAWPPNAVYSLSREGNTLTLMIPWVCVPLHGVSLSQLIGAVVLALAGKPSVAQGAVTAQKKTPTPEEQARIDRIKASMAPKPAAKPELAKPATPEQQAQQFRQNLGKKPEGGQPAPVKPEAPKAPEPKVPAAQHLADVLEGKPTKEPADAKAAVKELKATFESFIKPKK
jgi:FtsZ-interacting cell division protein ZipA